jgi:DNA repair exonuclease SbcCD ATPase subunit
MTAPDLPAEPHVEASENDASEEPVEDGPPAPSDERIVEIEQRVDALFKLPESLQQAWLKLLPLTKRHVDLSIGVQRAAADEDYARAGELDGELKLIDLKSAEGEVEQLQQQLKQESGQLHAHLLDTQHTVEQEKQASVEDRDWERAQSSKESLNKILDAVAALATIRTPEKIQQDAQVEAERATLREEEEKLEQEEGNYEKNYEEALEKEAEEAKTKREAELQKQREEKEKSFEFVLRAAQQLPLVSSACSGDVQCVCSGDMQCLQRRHAELFADMRIHCACACGDACYVCGHE